MSTTAVPLDEKIQNARTTTNDMKLEVVIIPVSDVGRAKDFYAKLGWRLDAEFTAGDDFHVIQFTPPGSGCSVIFGKNITAAAPGSAQGLYLIVSDIAAARAELVRRGVEIGEVLVRVDDVQLPAHPQVEVAIGERSVRDTRGLLGDRIRLPRVQRHRSLQPE